MINIPATLRIAEGAGQIILSANARDCDTSSGQSEQPLVDARLLAHSHIRGWLQKLTPDIPVLADVANELQQKFQDCWLFSLVDRVAVAGEATDQLTVTIALLEKGEPSFGLVHMPAQGITYWGSTASGAFKITADGNIQTLSLQLPLGPLVIPCGSFCFLDEFTAFIAGLRDSETERLSSSSKRCLVAEGSTAVVHPMGLKDHRDTAAARAIVEAAGGQILAWPSLVPLHYRSESSADLARLFIVVPASSSELPRKASSQSGGIVYERREHDSKAEVIWHKTQVNPTLRAASLKQVPRCIWLTGLSGSGKSTIANSLELALHEAGRHTFLLDGDNVRHGLNRDLGMSAADRTENIRRVGEVAKLMVDAGMIVITAFISPFRADRDKVRALFSEEEFVEVFVDTSLDECERRDVKGLYAKARRGELKDFTGIDSRYERPESPNVHLLAGESSVYDCVKTLMLALNEPWVENTEYTDENQA